MPRSRGTVRYRFRGNSGFHATPKPPRPVISLDWTNRLRPQSAADGHLTAFPLGPECVDPASLAMDNAHTRLFAACSNRKLVVLNADTGDKVTTLPIGPGVEAVGYDSEHGLLLPPTAAPKAA